MAFLFDNIVATFIAGILILLLASVSLRQSDESGAISNRRALASTTASISVTLRADLENTASVQSWNDSTIVLLVTDDPVAGTQTTVTYERLTRASGGVPVFDVRRTVGAKPSVTAPGLSGWSTLLLDASGGATTDPAATQQITARFSLPSPFASRRELEGRGGTLDTVWEHTFSPPLLSGVQF